MPGSPGISLRISATPGKGECDVVNVAVQHRNPAHPAEAESPCGLSLGIPVKDAAVKNDVGWLQVQTGGVGGRACRIVAEVDDHEVQVIAVVTRELDSDETEVRTNN